MIVARCGAATAPKITVMSKTMVILSITIFFNTIPRFQGFLSKPMTTTPQTPLLSSIRTTFHHRAFAPQKSLKRKTTMFTSSSSGNDNNDTTNADDINPSPTSSPPSTPPPPPRSDFTPPPPPDPLVSMMTRPSGSTTSSTEKTVNLPILGEVPDDDSLPVILGAMSFGALGILLSIVVAFNARDEVFATLSAVNPPPPKKEVRVDDGRCRGICADQEGSLKDLSLLMESLRRVE